MRNLSVLFFLIITGCQNEDPNFRYVDLADFKYEKAEIKDQAQIDVISFTGGRECTGNTTYYYQFIGIDKSSGDTVRILTPCQVIKEGLRPVTGTFSPWDNTEKLIEDALTKQNKTGFLSDNGVVVFNKRYGDIEERNYKTAIGTLSFDTTGH